MDKTRKAFTLVELLTTVAIICILAAIIFPVFHSAVVAAQKTVCASNFHQAYIASALYLSDYDDTFMPVNHQPAETPNSKNDRTWVQMLLPYLKTYAVFRCPADRSQLPQSEAVFDQDLVPGDVYSRYYTVSLRSNIGFNYLYLAPIVKDGGAWRSLPRTSSMIEKPSHMLMFVDSVWDRDASGHPTGGGSWLVIPPCRFSRESGGIVDSFNLIGKEVFSESAGWTVQDRLSAKLYGGAWPWHAGRMTIIHVDGSIGTVDPGELAEGCHVEPNWNGLIDRQGHYIWDMK